MKKFAALFLLVAACGSKAVPVTTTTTTQPVAHNEHGDMPTEIVKFHDVLAPLWHDDKNPERMANTCAALPNFDAPAAALLASTMPDGGDKDKWAAAGPTLTASMTDLKAKCDAKDTAGFEPAFAAMHNAFHGYMEATGKMKMEPKHEHGAHGAVSK
ncbi:MAG: hypothetical protein KBG15_05375 [Kofleriaceae bacterium]|nr:hypothetical protein [Kofleriaceae bacterium]